MLTEKVSKDEIGDLGCILYNGAQYLNFAYNNCNSRDAQQLKQIKELEKIVFNLSQEIESVETKESLRSISENLSKVAGKVKEIRYDKYVNEYLDQGIERMNMVIESINKLLC